MTTANLPSTDSSLSPPGGLSKKAKTVLCATVFTLLGVGLSAQISGFEAELLRQVLPAVVELGVPIALNKVAQQTIAGQIAELIVLFTTSFVCLSWGRDRIQNPKYLMFVAIGATIISCIIQTALFAAVASQPLYATTFVEAVLSGLTGLILKKEADKKKLLESRHYELVIRNDELDKARLALVEQDEIGRRLLAADLHDQVLNDLKKIVETFTQFESDPSKEKSSTIRSAFNKTMTDIREIMDDLSPIMLQNFGLRAALEDCLEKGKERSGYDANFECSVDDQLLDKISTVRQTLLFRLVQESLTNISKHAQAKNVSVTVSRKGDTLIITVEDDGKGINYDTISHQSRGLRYMKLRADLISAVIDWKAGANDKGTKVIITYPLQVELSA